MLLIYLNLKICLSKKSVLKFIECIEQDIKNRSILFLSIDFVSYVQKIDLAL